MSFELVVVLLIDGEPVVDEIIKILVEFLPKHLLYLFGHLVVFRSKSDVAVYAIPNP